ncbi:hypothetical protein GCM10027269_52160 [Kribbella endophytica]
MLGPGAAQEVFGQRQPLGGCRAGSKVDESDGRILIIATEGPRLERSAIRSSLVSTGIAASQAEVSPG